MFTVLCVHLHLLLDCFYLLYFFFFNDTATTEIYTLSLHDALPILQPGFAQIGVDQQHPAAELRHHYGEIGGRGGLAFAGQDRKSTRLNSSHSQISYAVFCLKKKKKKIKYTQKVSTNIDETYNIFLR